MSRDMSMPGAQVEVFAVQRRRRFSAEERKRYGQIADGCALHGPEMDTPASPDSALHSPFRSVSILCWPFIIPGHPDLAWVNFDHFSIKA
jgi:hypothetical protein